MLLRALALAAIFTCTLSPTLLAQQGQQDPDWTAPQTPFRIVGNLYYVGSKDLASYLIVTPQGDILINSNLTSSAPAIRRSIEALGFHLSDVKILLISHAHLDHAGGSAAILRLTQAKYMVMDADVPVIESGGHADFAFGHRPGNFYPPAKVDRILHDGDQIHLGDVTLTAHLTAGHTKGCTTWTFQQTESGHTYNIVIVGSPNVLPQYKLIDNPTYPNIAKDFIHQFQVLHSLPCDIFLGAHASYFNMQAKLARKKAGDPNPFLDPAGYQSYIAEREQAFHLALAKQSPNEPLQNQSVNSGQISCKFIFQTAPQRILPGE
jgi:metallo-beta-lactamase class B